MTHRAYDDEESPAYQEWMQWLDDREANDLPWVPFEDFLKMYSKTEPAPAPDFDDDTMSEDIPF